MSGNFSEGHSALKIQTFWQNIRPLTLHTNIIVKKYVIYRENASVRKKECISVSEQDLGAVEQNDKS